MTAYLPKEQRKTMDRRLATMNAETDPAAGLRKATLLAKELELAYPDAAGSLREGLEEMFTVIGSLIAQWWCGRSRCEALVWR